MSWHSIRRWRADAQGLEEAAKNAKKQGSSSVTLAAPPPPAPGDPKKDEVQGVL